MPTGSLPSPSLLPFGSAEWGLSGGFKWDLGERFDGRAGDPTAWAASCFPVGVLSTCARGALAVTEEGLDCVETRCTGAP